MRLLARLPTGADYDESVMLQTQLRLAGSGYYDSVFLVMDTEAPDPLTAPVIAQLREAQYQRLVFGVGINTDIGAHFSIDHIHNEPIVGWRALSKLAYDNETATISSDWMSLPNKRLAQGGGRLAQTRRSGQLHRQQQPCARRPQPGRWQPYRPQPHPAVRLHPQPGLGRAPFRIRREPDLGLDRPLLRQPDCTVTRHGPGRGSGPRHYLDR